MIRNMDELMTAATSGKKHTLAVACAHDLEVLRAVWTAHKAGFAKVLLVGDASRIRRLAENSQLSLDDFSIVHEPNERVVCQKAVSLIREGKADMLMKGAVPTAVLMRAALDRNDGLRRETLLSHVALLELRKLDRLLLLTDAALNIAPGLEEKKKILENAVRVAHAMGNPSPIVACLCAVEKVNSQMPATVDAAALTEECRQGNLPGCQVFGPAALDNALFSAAARRKGLESPPAGCADVLLVPDIEAGNMLYKAFALAARAGTAGVVVGAQAPVILASRADSRETMMHSIALAMVVMEAETAGGL